MPLQAAAPTPPAPPPGPSGSPMAQPSANDGAKQMGAVNVESAMQMLEQALPALSSNSEEGKAVLEALSKLSKHFNRQKSKDLVPAQLMELARAQKQSPMAGMIADSGAQGAAPIPQAA